MKASENEERRVYHRLAFEARIQLVRLDDRLAESPQAVRTALRQDLRMLHWLQLDNQYAFVRDSALRSKPALSPLIRLVDAKLNFLASELFSRYSLDAPLRPVEMSATGISFDWPQALPPDSLWLVTIACDGVEAPLKLPAVVQRTGDGSEESTLPIAMVFFALSEDEIDALASWIVARQAQELSRRRSTEED